MNITKRRFLKILFWALGVPLAMVILFVGLVYFGAWGKIPTKKQLADFQYQRASEIYSADSVLIGKFYLYDRQPIGYEQFPDHLVNALVAIEDERFYEHKGIDTKSLFRVFFKTILLQDVAAGGGSTLTQQLAKNLYPRRDRKKAHIAVNKIKEIIMAKRLEKVLSKKEIITHYLNTVSFGGNTFGIESASLKFFDKPTKSLTIEEAAVLIGMLKATHGYNPKLFPEKSIARRNLVFSAMANNDFISKKEKDSLAQLPLNLKYRDYGQNEGIAPYFREAVRKELLQWSKDFNGKKPVNIYTSGLKIHTTLNHEMQLLAEKTMQEHMQSLQRDFEKSHGKNAPWLVDKNLIRKQAKKLGIYKRLKDSGMTEDQIWDSLSVKKTMKLSFWEGEKEYNASTLDSICHYMKFLNVGSLGIDPNNGAIRTWIGGIDYAHFKYDHVSQSKRQVGSTFKPVVYTAALEKGLDPCGHISAREVEYKNLEGWSPSNSSDEDEAYLNYSMEEALSKSVNTIAVKVLEKTGIETVIEQAQKMGIEEELPKKPSLALGTGEIKIIELAGAYASYVNASRPVTPMLITSITTANDSILRSFSPRVQHERAFSEETREVMLEMMKATVNKGTASRIRNVYALKNDVAGKTGTTQYNKDAWFVAVMPKMVHVSWVGLDNHEIGFKNTRLGQGASAALPLFALLLREMNKNDHFDTITKVRFTPPKETALARLDCEPIKRDGFLKRLFTNPNKKKKRRFKN
ncbi:transglycosylase domain-containing protein [Allomuricauda sp. SCSIO 65647]|uniref:transglycosylase domain-containing protein n=1 Tax=Allomuricauda sp. SCSIO 65647 TaxID=2908843 RepID=UPI001F2D0B27|nr:transglycosylase domain-containing protein [Muricauda sp. SCSIO 65647]UJH68029.1 transglycosylase domain-containing protein [Muricauda sp. SCSIO 65647]